MKATPLTKLIDYIEREHSYFLEFGTADCSVKVIRSKAKELLEEERGNIEEAYTQGGLEYLHVHNEINRSFGKEVDIEVVKNDEYFTKNYTQK